MGTSDDTEGDRGLLSWVGRREGEGREYYVESARDDSSGMQYSKVAERRNDALTQIG